jgi:transmembrane sensor
MKPLRSKFNTQIYQEACEWFVECRAGDLGRAARADFDRWLRKSPEHQSAYLEIAAIWNEGANLDPSNRWTIDKLIAQAVEGPANIVSLEAIRSTSHTPIPSRASRRPLFGIAASILLATAALGVYILTSGGFYATGLGEQRSLALSDGSTVQLNALSKIRIHYGKHQRDVDLVRGQALFHVAKDPARPFIVHSGQTSIRAVGTQFDVYRKTDGTVVTVVEGRVAVLEHEGDQGLKGPSSGTEAADIAQQAGEGGAIFVTAGEQITVSPKTVHRTEHPNLAGATSWTQRQLIFDSASLAEVADEFNRYNERKLVIETSALGDLHISGVFSSTDPASLIRFLRDRPGLRVTETSTEIRIGN